MPHLISIKDFSRADILNLLKQAHRIKASPLEYKDVARGKILAILFFEPSTRTYFSFSAAMQKLGGGVIGFNDTGNTSAAKGETLEDTARIMAGYSNVMAIRSSEVGLCRRLSEKIHIPLINAGEGAEEHPTQTLLDLMTIHETFGKLDVRVSFYGDLRFGRTNHSLFLALMHFVGEVNFIAPKGLEMPDDYLALARKNKVRVNHSENIEDFINHTDVLYVSRLQKERWPLGALENLEEEKFVVTEDLANQMPEKSVILHPLPRVNEIHPSVDRNLRAGYFRQAENGLFMRMAILQNVLNAPL